MATIEIGMADFNKAIKGDIRRIIQSESSRLHNKGNLWEYFLHLNERRGKALVGHDEASEKFREIGAAMNFVNFIDGILHTCHSSFEVRKTGRNILVIIYAPYAGLSETCDELAERKIPFAYSPNSGRAENHGRKFRGRRAEDISLGDLNYERRGTA